MAYEGKYQEKWIRYIYNIPVFPTTCVCVKTRTASKCQRFALRDSCVISNHKTDVKWNIQHYTTTMNKVRFPRRTSSMAWNHQKTYYSIRLRSDLLFFWYSTRRWMPLQASDKRDAIRFFYDVLVRFNEQSSSLLQRVRHSRHANLSTFAKVRF